MNAIKTNPACKALYERLRANGKTGKQGLIAVFTALKAKVKLQIELPNAKFNVAR